MDFLIGAILVLFTASLIGGVLVFFVGDTKENAIDTFTYKPKEDTKPSVNFVIGILSNVVCFGVKLGFDFGMLVKPLLKKPKGG